MRLKNSENLVSKETQTLLDEESLVKFSSVKENLICKGCQRAFETPQRIYEHYENWKHKKEFECPNCCQSFAKNFNLEKHSKVCTGKGRPSIDFQPRAPGRKKRPTTETLDSSVGCSLNEQTSTMQEGSSSSSSSSSSSKTKKRRRLSQVGSANQHFPKQNPSDSKLASPSLAGSRTKVVYSSNKLQASNTTSVLDVQHDNDDKDEDDEEEEEVDKDYFDDNDDDEEVDVDEHYLQHNKKLINSRKKDDDCAFTDDDKEEEVKECTTLKLPENGQNLDEADFQNDENRGNDEGQDYNFDDEDDPASCYMIPPKRRKLVTFQTDIVNSSHVEMVKEAQKEDKPDNADNFQQRKAKENDSEGSHLTATATTTTTNLPKSSSYSSILEEKEYAGSNNESTLENPKDPPPLKTHDGHYQLLLAIWEINDNSKTNQPQEPQRQQQQQSNVGKYLSGITPAKTTIEKLAYILSLQLEQQVGKGVVGTLVLNYARFASMKNLIDLLKLAKEKEEKERIEEEKDLLTNSSSSSSSRTTKPWTTFYAPLIELCVLHHAQKKAHQETLNDDLIDQLPQSVVNKIDFGGNGDCMSRDSNARFLRFLDLACEMIKDSAKAQEKEVYTTSSFFGAEKSWNERCNAWFEMSNLVRKAFETESSQSLFQILLVRARPRGLGTVNYLNLQYNTHRANLELHSEIVGKVSSRCSVISEPMIGTVNVDMIDTEMFIHLLYGTRKIMPHEISFGTFRIAELLQIDNIWQFLFGEGIDIKSYDGLNKSTIFQILLRVGAEQDLDIVARNFHNWMPIEDYETCMQFCSINHVISFFSRDEVYLDELLIYKLLVNWACHYVGKKCIPFADLKPDPEVKHAFMRVQNCLRLKRLYKKRSKIIPHKFISLNDWTVLSNAMERKNSSEAVNLEGRFNLNNRILTIDAEN